MNAVNIGLAIGGIIGIFTLFMGARQARYQRNEVQARLYMRAAVIVTVVISVLIYVSTIE